MNLLALLTFTAVGFAKIGKSALIVNDSEDLLCKLCYASCIMLGSGEKHEDISFGDTWSYSCASSRPEGDEEFDVREVEHGTIVVADEEDEVYHISEFIDANSGNGGKHLHIHMRDHHHLHHHRQDHDHDHLADFDHQAEHPSKTRADAVLNVVHPKLQKENREEM
jgi:hypothetical protein